jgi:hypothetical protein
MVLPSEDVTGADLLTGVVAGVVAAAVWAFLALLNRQRRFRRLKRWNGAYRIFEKSKNRAEPETLSIRTTGNLLEVRFANMPDGQSVEGQIVMDEQTLKGGKGQYEHTTSKEQAWGFWEVQLKEPDMILVHTTFTTRAGPVVRGYVWRQRVD